ncbi:hypothetical protein C3369_00875 [Escherichia sp. ESNIH1]|uniref:hypothetical protein n=1 Tax=Enterobacteriaceae TaxID=543 RepID=UPI000CDDC90B|nr:MULTISPECIES: hypothetical protein [Enterobacteriaceae]POU03949.1 hypothetical protein C3369_00875 [Escherichia sp. ESNIH1]
MIRTLLCSIGSVFFLIASSMVHAEMIPSSEIGNDPALVKLCKSRLTTISGKSVPFEIEADYVKSARSYNPEATFIAIKGSAPTLVVCQQNSGTGKFGPFSYEPENKLWQFANKPQKFSPSIGSAQGRTLAGKACLDAAMTKIDSQGFKNAVTSRVVEIVSGSPLYHPGKVIAGQKSQEYDIATEGSAFFQSNGPDLKETKYSCLLSPMLDVKAVKVN